MRFNKLSKKELDALKIDQTELSPEMREYGYNLFGLNQLNQTPQITIPFRPEDQIETSQVEEIPALEQTRQPSSIERLSEQLTKKTKPIEEKLEIKSPMPEKKSDEIGEMLKQSEQKERDIEFQKQLAKTRDAIMGVGLGRQIQGDYSMYEEMAKQAKKPIENMIPKQELEDKKSKTDPNS